VLGASLESEQSRGYFPGHALVNRYGLIRLLGEGGTGVVWVAHDRVLNLDVAVKLVRQTETARDDFARRTQLEACSAARIAHPAVCRAMDFGLSAYGEPFVVSELLNGESLDDVLGREGRLSPTHAVRILLPILDALRAAHENGIVHRDVKPGNIFLARDGLQRLQPKLLDFGIACWLDDTRVKNESGIWGTPEYMSPEQVRGSQDIDGRSDLWNFCATLYETLTGVIPFQGESHAAILRAVQSVDPEPITTYCTGDDELSRIVLCGLRRDRADRYQSARELAAELCHWLLAQGVETDICDHSLRARLLDPSRPGRGRDTPAAHVVPRDEPIRRTGAAPYAERALASGSVKRRLKRFWLPAAAGALLVAGASSFQALRANQPFERALAPRALSPSEVAAIDPPQAVTVAPQPVAVAPQPFTRDGSATVEVIGSAVTAANLAALPAPPLPVYPLPSPSTRRALPTTPSARATSTPPATPPPPPAARRHAKNALDYDFGL
jgi:eukaryotic-like serine/threonine-protein kinase